ARLDDALFQAPTLEARILEVEIGVVDAPADERAEDAFQLPCFEVERGQQRCLRGFEDQNVLLFDRAGRLSRTFCMRAESISARTMPSPSGRSPRISPHGSTIIVWP